jgi:hypothetical protein
VALRMRDIDQTEEGGVASIGIESAFQRHGIRLPALTARREKARSPYRALRALDPDRPGGEAAIRAALGLSPGAKLERRSWKARVGGGSREQLIHRDRVTVRDKSLGALSGIQVAVVCGCTLTREPDGTVQGASLKPHPHPESKEIARWLRPWVVRGAIRPPGAGPAAPAEHFRARQPFRVTPAGLLERVFFD